MFLLFYTKGWVQMRDLQKLLDELKDMSFFKKGELCIIGCSTSEVIGEKLVQWDQWILLKKFLKH